VVILSMASAFHSAQHRYKRSSRRADDPVHAVEECATVVLAPELDARVYFYESSEGVYCSFEALDFGRSDVRESCCRMSVEGGEGHIVEVDQTNLPDPTASG
jgi:hypothetical protein